jgi:MerR family copper efflux transcriptional regulator
MRITEAASRLGTSPRMLRYRDLLGLLPPVRETRHRVAQDRAAQDRETRHRVAQDRETRGRETRGREAPAGGPRATRRGAPAHRHFDDEDLAAMAMALDFERRYDVSPAAVAFGMRVLTEPKVRAELAEFGRRIGRIPPPPVRALEFEKERALRLLSLTPTGAGLTGGGGGAGAPHVSPGRSRPPWTPGTDPAQGRSSPRSAPRP